MRQMTTFGQRNNKKLFVYSQLCKTLVKQGKSKKLNSVELIQAYLIVQIKALVTTSSKASVIVMDQLLIFKIITYTYECNASFQNQYPPDTKLKTCKTDDTRQTGISFELLYCR